MTFRPTKETCTSKVERVLQTMGAELTAAEIAMLIPDEPRNRISSVLSTLANFKVVAARDEIYRGIKIPLWRHTPETDTRRESRPSITEATIHRNMPVGRMKRAGPKRTRNKF